MTNWITTNFGLIVIIALYLVGYVIVKYYLKAFLIRQSRKRSKINQ
jgi:hypothetical protein